MGALADELSGRVDEIFRQRWDTRVGQVVPEAEDLRLSNEAVEFKTATVLYADLSGSTDLVNTMTWQFAAEIYKTFLHCAARVIGSEGGTVTAYDGDRVMAVFIGNTKNTSAARTALKINFCVKDVINPLIKACYPKTEYQLKHVTGVDTSSVRAARTGVRGANDLVWVGRAANYAAKLTELNEGFASWITGDVYDALDDSARSSAGRSMWESRTWKAMGITVYRSNWTWRV